MDVRIVVDDKEYSVGYGTYKGFIKSLAFDDDAYMELLDHVAREGTEAIRHIDVRKRFLKDETFLFLFEHGDGFIIDELLGKAASRRLVTFDTLKEKWDILTSETF